MRGFKNRQRTEFIVIHCSRTHPEELDHKGDPVGYAHIERKHNLKGIDCGYHWVIQRDGSAIAARPDSVAGNHCPGVNGRSVGICLIGGLSPFKNFESNFTEDQWQTLRQTCEYLLRKYPQAKVVGHNNVAKTECPAFDVTNWWGVHSHRHKPKETNDPHSTDPQAPPVS